MHLDDTCIARVVMMHVFYISISDNVSIDDWSTKCKVLTEKLLCVLLVQVVGHKVEKT